ncbi:50S ribosomal protein L15 [Pantoea sp. Aalb]|uniref:50S ribosomal protein L15 n=1 Tax=Pantoea sp. Aalb TaxID=2576762 RepID=UPI0013269203|nr:50S ribosomal protein L15 [Pantoea sp. Aalb]MXP67899.1 50S ribosomal protein L15 [Pantoea sp. Aalb]
MRLNTLAPAAGAKHASKRLARGIGSGLGKTGGRGHKGQKSRSGSGIYRGFEGGQMPLYRRLPKFGFTSRKSLFTTEIRLSDLMKIKDNSKVKDNSIVDIKALKLTNIINNHIKFVKVILSGKISIPITIHGLRVTKGARSAIEAVGGNIKEY